MHFFHVLKEVAGVMFDHTTLCVALGGSVAYGVILFVVLRGDRREKTRR